MIMYWMKVYWFKELTAGWARKKVSHMCVYTHRETREKTEVSIDADVCGSWGPSLLHPTERFENFHGDTSFS